MIKTEKNDKKLEISFLSPFELVDTESWNLIDIWKQESSDDKHLMDYFLETPAYIEMQKTEKYLVCWRKWTWKTALRRAFIANNSREDSCILDIQAEDIFTPSFFNKITQSVIDDHQYALKKDYKDKIKLLLLIKWVELIIDCDTYYNNQLQKNRLPEAIKNILTKFLELNWYTLWGDMWSRIFQLEKITIEESIWTAFWVKWINLNWSKKSTSTLNPLEFDLEEIRPYLEAYVFELLFRTWKKCFLFLFGW